MQRNMIWSHFVEKCISLRNPWALGVQVARSVEDGNSHLTCCANAM